MRPLLVLLLAGMVAVGCTSERPRESSGSPQPPLVVVPSVVGMRVSEARRTLRASDFRLILKSEVAQERRGQVIDQTPAAGEEQPPGTQIILTLSKGWPRVPSFDTIGGVALTRARSQLRRAGFRLDNVIHRYDNYYSLYAPDRVFASSPRSYRRVPPGTAVTLFIAKAFRCTPGYLPCLVPHLQGFGNLRILADYDCAGGTGDGPYFVYSTVRVTGDDEYELDGNDNDGYGCE
jgi:hypothetical protein